MALKLHKKMLIKIAQPGDEEFYHAGATFEDLDPLLDEWEEVGIYELTGKVKMRTEIRTEVKTVKG